mmetsp:Transcript_50378/g.90039  ORF Transcript_50378/g.90039 Transcript_50378/m.90039 type:complete len:249 (-) Transcript_50378:267-1013(-)
MSSRLSGRTRRIGSPWRKQGHTSNGGLPTARCQTTCRGNGCAPSLTFASTLVQTSHARTNGNVVVTRVFRLGPGSRAPVRHRPRGPRTGVRARRGHRPPPARRPGNPGHVHRRGVLGPLHPRAVPSAGQDVIVLSDDASQAQGLPTGHHQRADIPHSSRQSSVRAESSESTSTLSSSSTSSLSSTTTSSLPSSSSAGDERWSDVERDMAPVASESDEWDVLPETDAVTGEVDVVARRNPKGGGSQGPA